MHSTDVQAFSGPGWLSELIEHAVKNGVCVRWGCTTCGAMPFRKALFASAEGALGPGDTVHFEIARGLRYVPFGDRTFEALRFVIMVLYIHGFPIEFYEKLLPIFLDTPAGEAYRRMDAHHKALAAARAATSPSCASTTAATAR